MRYFLGIDPGINKLGYALIDESMKIIDSGIILSKLKTFTRSQSFGRIKDIYDFFDNLTRNYNIVNVGIEKLYFTRFNQANAEFVYGVRGALLMLFLSKNINVSEYGPTEIKKAISLNGKAEKILIQKTVYKIFGLKDVPQYADAADALAIAYIVYKKFLYL